MAWHPEVKSGQFWAVLPFLTTVALIYSSKDVLLVLVNGHLEDLPKDVVQTAMLLSAALAAPASVYISHVWGQGQTIMSGLVLATAGVVVPTQLITPLTKVLVFAICGGSGLSIMFQASSIAVSFISLNSTFVFLVFILGMSAFTMLATEHLVQLATLTLGDHVIPTLAGFVFLVIFCPAVVMAARELNSLESEDVSWQASDNCEEKCVHLEEDMLESQTTEAATAAGSKCGQDRPQPADCKLIYLNLQWRACAMVWWAAGIDLSLTIRAKDHFDQRPSAVMCILSLLTVCLNKLQSKYQFDHMPENNQADRTSFLMLGILGISGLVQHFDFMHTDILPHHLVFVTGFFLQLDGRQNFIAALQTNSHCHNIPDQKTETHRHLYQIGQNLCERIYHSVHLLTDMVNEFCVELVISFCAVILGFLISYPAYYLLHIPAVTDFLLADTSSLVMSIVAVVLSFYLPQQDRITSLLTLPFYQLN